MNKLKQIKPWKFYFKVFLFFTFYVSSFAQNKLITEIDINDVDTISINGDQIFFIGVKATNTSAVRITSIIDGEYENNYQIITNKVDNVLNINLEQIVFSSISDDKRNAHKVIAAKLLLELPENMILNIKSDIASVDLNGNFDAISIQLYQGYFNLNGISMKATVKTVEGNINIITPNANVKASSNNGIIHIHPYLLKGATYNLTTVNGNINVKKPD